MNKHMDQLMTLMGEQGFDALALNPGQSLVYLTGLHFHLMERPTVLIINHTGDAAVILPELEQGKLAVEAVGFRAFAYSDDPAAWPGVFDRAANVLGLKGGKLGVEPTRLRFLEIQYLRAAFPEMELADGGPALDALRIRKDEAYKTSMPSSCMALSYSV